MQLQRTQAVREGEEIEREIVEPMPEWEPQPVKEPAPEREPAKT